MQAKVLDDVHIVQSYLDLLVGAVSGLKTHLESPNNALVVDLLLAPEGVTLSPSMEELLKVRVPLAYWPNIVGPQVSSVAANGLSAQHSIRNR